MPWKRILQVTGYVLSRDLAICLERIQTALSMTQQSLYLSSLLSDEWPPANEQPLCRPS